MVRLSEGGVAGRADVREGRSSTTKIIRKAHYRQQTYPIPKLTKKPTHERIVKWPNNKHHTLRILDNLWLHRPRVDTKRHSIGFSPFRNVSVCDKGLVDTWSELYEVCFEWGTAEVLLDRSFEAGAVVCLASF